MFRIAPRPDGLARNGSPPKALRLPRCPPPPLRADPRRRSVVPLAAGGRPLRRHRSPRRDGHHAVVPRRVARHGTGLLDGDCCLTADAVRPRGDGDRFGQAPLPRDDRDAAAAVDGDEHYLAGDACVVFTAALGIPRGPMGSRQVSGPPSTLSLPDAVRSVRRPRLCSLRRVPVDLTDRFMADQLAVFAAMMKSLRCGPLILCVHHVTVARPHSVSRAG
jgi:hypothetical protein